MSKTVKSAALVPEIRIIPMSKNEFADPVTYRDATDIQNKYFLDLLIRENNGRYYRKKGINSIRGALLLFQYDAKIIASAVLEENVDQPYGEYSGYYKVDQSSVKVFQPIVSEELKAIVKDFGGFHQSKQSIPTEYYAEIKKLIDRKASSTTDKVFVVDLYTGRYLDHSTGGEAINFIKRDDGRYYGYCPPFGNIDIGKLEDGASDKVEGVLVVYVKAVGAGNIDREVIGYCENATVYRQPQPGDKKGLSYIDRNGNAQIATYYIESDNLVDLRWEDDKYVIHTPEINSYMFRKQRSYLTDYPNLKNDLIRYFKDRKITSPYEETDQERIQKECAASKEYSAAYGKQPDEVVPTPAGQAVKKNAAIAKKVLVDSGYRCLCDATHTTFTTAKGVPYMEGHHLIPCTVSNSAAFKDKSKLDREENIVCICPNCHRAIHFGNTDTKERLVTALYNQQKSKLFLVGLDISLDDLLEKYR